MTLGKHGIRALGLSLLAAIGLMAVGAAGASGETGRLLILNEGKTVLSELDATFGAEVDLLSVLHAPAINLEIHCTSFTVNEGKYLVSDHVGHIKLLITGCALYQLSPLTALSGCEVYETALDRTHLKNPGNIIAEALLLILKHNGASGSQVVIRAEPPASLNNAFAHLFFRNCPTGSSALVSGGLTLRAHDDSGTHLIKHLFEEASGNFKLDQLKYGSNDANILGGTWVFLTGEHVGREWGLC
jgi:hypothetical protein